MKINDLNLNELSNSLISFPIAANHMDANSLQEAAELLTGDSTLESEYLHDLFSLSTDDIINKWYGGQDGLLVLHRSMLKK
ncbi:hypothetical protein [Vagococcus fluvialis]|uniref:hypothetical protein n=1 Tax=Vagococcus fluvialis TaxID=2738 RepID=UPI003B215FB4